MGKYNILVRRLSSLPTVYVRHHPNHPRIFHHGARSLFRSIISTSTSTSTSISISISISTRILFFSAPTPTPDLIAHEDGVDLPGVPGREYRRDPVGRCAVEMGAGEATRVPFSPFSASSFGSFFFFFFFPYEPETQGAP